MAKKLNKTQLKEAFKLNELPQKMMGNFIEEAVQYRAYYIDGSEKMRWAGPWRSDLAAASTDGMPYAQQGFETGIRRRIN